MGTRYAPLGLAASHSGTSTAFQFAMPVNGELADFAVTLSSSPSTGDSYNFTVRINNVDSGLACSVSGSGTTCSSAGPVSVSAGDLVNVMITESGSPSNVATAMWTIVYRSN